MGNSNSPSSAPPVVVDSKQQPKDEEIFANRNRQKTFNVKKGSMRFQKGMTLKASLAATLQGQVDMREAVKLPSDQDLNEWLAINTFIFYEIAVNVHKSVEHVCTKESCPKMTAGKNVVYLWADGKKVKKPVEMSAPEYIENLFEWVFEQMSDPSIFPQDDDSKFPKTFVKTVKNIYKRLFRLYAHIFHTHFQEVEASGAEAHLNSSFKHLMYFILEFDLVEESELVPLKNLIDILKQPAQ
jgi:MOB kinase activator 1